MNPDDLFETLISFPDNDAQQEYAELVGLDTIKASLSKEAELILNPELLVQWSKKTYNKTVSLVRIFKNRPPLFLFSGDVGTGKTALAESFADGIARQHGIAVYLYKLSLNARGSGMVGEMTKLIAEAFGQITAEAEKRKNGKSALILMIDEADALAQSRETSQMHHEDRAGVNALIRGIDSVRKLPIPVLVVMCTNRASAIDPAVKRRAVQWYSFSRPSLDDCLSMLTNYLSELGISAEQLHTIASACAKHESAEYGYTYSDITQRLLPAIVMDAIPDKPITFEQIMHIIKNVMPTEPFDEVKS